MATEQFAGTVRFIGLRASFKEAKKLLNAARENGLSPELSDEIEAFLAQFEADA